VSVNADNYNASLMEERGYRDEIMRSLSARVRSGAGTPCRCGARGCFVPSGVKRVRDLQPKLARTSARRSGQACRASVRVRVWTPTVPDVHYPSRVDGLGKELCRFLSEGLREDVEKVAR